MGRSRKKRRALERKPGLLDRYLPHHRVTRWSALIGFFVLIGSPLLAALAWFTGRVTYPVELTYVNQFETQTGYVLEITANSLVKKRTVHVNRDDFRAKLVLDDSAFSSMSPTEREKVISSVRVEPFDNRSVLDAAVEGRSYTNVPYAISLVDTPRPLYLLLTVDGPGSSNPSARFQLGRVYRSVKIMLGRRTMSREYLEVPLRHIPIVAGDANTRILGR